MKQDFYYVIRAREGDMPGKPFIYAVDDETEEETGEPWWFKSCDGYAQEVTKDDVARFKSREAAEKHLNGPNGYRLRLDTTRVVKIKVKKKPQPEPLPRIFYVSAACVATGASKVVDPYGRLETYRLGTASRLVARDIPVRLVLVKEQDEQS